MFRRSKKGIALLALMALLMTMLPIGTAFASTTEVLFRPTVSDDSYVELGTVFMEITAGKIKNNDTATVRLPEGFKFANADNSLQDSANALANNGWVGPQWSAADQVYTYGNGLNYFAFPVQYLDNSNALVTGGVGLQVSTQDDNEVSIRVVGTPTSGQNSYMYVYLGRVYVDSGFDGDITATIDAPSGSGISSGSVTVGRVTGGAVDMEVTNAPTFTDSTVNAVAADDEDVVVRVKEDTADALSDENESIKMILPDGIEYVGTHPNNVDVLWGAAKVDPDQLASDAERTAYLGAVAPAVDADGLAVITALEPFLKQYTNLDADELTLDLPDTFESTSALNFEFEFDVTVADETDADTGDVKARVTGESDINVSELIIGQYGQYDITIEADEAPTVVAGMLEQEVAKVTVKESVEASLMDGRTIILTLPSNAKWGKVDEDSDANVDLNFAGFPGKDGKAAKWVVANQSTDAAELVLDDLEVVLEPGFEGDLVAEVSGTAGLDGELVLAKEVTAVTVEASSKPVIGIGQGSQEIGDITITEVEAGAIADGQDMTLDLPEGVSWAGVPKVEVTEGDLEIDEDGITTATDNSDDNQLVIPIEDSSSIASTIKVSGIKLNIYRDVPESDIWVKVKGYAVAEVNNGDKVDDYLGNADVNDYAVISGEQAFKLKGDNVNQIFPETGTAAKTVIASVGTPGEASAEVKFVIGSTTYNVNGVEMTMDVAPYLKDGRTYLPVRYVAQALGVTESNILWDEATQKVTLIKGDKVLQVTIGSNIMLVNGVPITMDVPAEITSDRTMLPFRFIAQAFGADVAWDEATQTVTMTN